MSKRTEKDTLTNTCARIYSSGLHVMTFMFLLSLAETVRQAETRCDGGAILLFLLH